MTSTPSSPNRLDLSASDTVHMIVCIRPIATKRPPSLAPDNATCNTGPHNKIQPLTPPSETDCSVWHMFFDDPSAGTRVIAMDPAKIGDVAALKEIEGAKEFTSKDAGFENLEDGHGWLVVDKSSCREEEHAMTRRNGEQVATDCKDSRRTTPGGHPDTQRAVRDMLAGIVV